MALSKEAEKNRKEIHRVFNRQMKKTGEIPLLVFMYSPKTKNARLSWTDLHLSQDEHKHIYKAILEGVEEYKKAKIKNELSSGTGKIDNSIYH